MVVYRSLCAATIDGTLHPASDDPQEHERQHNAENAHHHPPSCRREKLQDSRACIHCALHGVERCRITSIGRWISSEELSPNVCALHQGDQEHDEEGEAHAAGKGDDVSSRVHRVRGRFFQHSVDTAPRGSF